MNSPKFNIFKYASTYSCFIVILNTKELAKKDPIVILLFFFCKFTGPKVTQDINAPRRVKIKYLFKNLKRGEFISAKFKYSSLILNMLFKKDYRPLR